MLYIILSIAIIIFICTLFFMKRSTNKENKNGNSGKNNKNFMIYSSLDLNNIKLPSKVKETIDSPVKIHWFESIGRDGFYTTENQGKPIRYISIGIYDEFVDFMKIKDGLTCNNNGKLNQ